MSSLKKRKRKFATPYYNHITPKNFPPGYYNAKVVSVRKAKNKSVIIVTIQMEKRIEL